MRIKRKYNPEHDILGDRRELSSYNSTKIWVCECGNEDIGVHGYHGDCFTVTCRYCGAELYEKDVR